MDFNKGIKEVEIEGEKISLKKSKLFGWGVVRKLKNPDGSRNWKNIIAGGSWIKLIFLALIILVFYGVAREYTTAIKIANQCLNANPIKIWGV